MCPIYQFIYKIETDAKFILFYRTLQWILVKNGAFKNLSARPRLNHSFGLIH
jgi:hypothetical protein